MFTKKISLFRLLSVIAVLIFAGPLIGNLLKVYQNADLDETTRFEQTLLFEAFAEDDDGDCDDE